MSLRDIHPKDLGSVPLDDLAGPRSDLGIRRGKPRHVCKNGRVLDVDLISHAARLRGAAERHASSLHDVDAPQAARGAAPPGAEDGSGRPARRRRRARLQQPAHGRSSATASSLLDDLPAESATRGRHCAGDPQGRRARRRRSRGSCSPSAASRCSQPRVLDLNERRRGHRAACCARLIGEDIELRVDARAERCGRCRPIPARSSR